MRHANADFAQISISGDKELLYFSYSDNGSGTNLIEFGNGLIRNGLKGINERISDIGGTVSFHSRPTNLSSVKV
ncbi:MAG: hypothetical protein M0T74_13280 [Desulfitobacterium hafniense]|nr:hypothetical protein [Desulfitobacterium hafniense]